MDTFISEDLRRESIMAIKEKFKQKNISFKNASEEEVYISNVNKDYEQDRLRRLYVPLSPSVPYPHESKRVMPSGFERT